jgi:PTS system N-acetylglucosamine-specific IIC component
LIVADQQRVDEKALKALGARGIVRPSERALQVVLGPIADQVATEIRSALSAVSKPADRILQGLGGRANLARSRVRGSRLLVEVKDPAKVMEAELRSCERGAVKTANHRWQIILGPEAITWAESASGLAR